MKSEIENLCAPATAAAGVRALRSLALALLAVEFLDELTYGASEAAWPLMRDDLALRYAEIGLLLSVPRIFGNLVEPLLFMAAEASGRRAFILGGGALFALSLALISLSTGFWSLLFALLLLHPAAGAFVSLSQAALMDADPARREQNMARWAFAGSAGQVAGSLAVAGSVAVGAGWRTLHAALAACALATLAAVRRFPLTTSDADAEDDEQGGAATRREDGEPRPAGASLVAALRGGAAGAWRALRQRNVVRWLALLELADLMLDGLHGFIALYFVDVAGVSEGRAAVAVTVWTGVGLAGDLLIIPLLERVRGLKYLRWSALASLALLPLFLLAPGVAAKLFVLALLGLGNSGWYAILKAQLYAALPGRSSTVVALHSAAGIVGGLVPLALGLFAERFGLAATMWLLLAGPLSLLVLIPRRPKD